jgi:hypothetical protein
MKNKQTGENEMRKKRSGTGRRENKHLLSSGEMLFAPVWLFVFYRFDFYYSIPKQYFTLERWK